MPRPTEALTPESGLQTVRESISQTIRQCMDEPNDMTQEQCAAMAYDEARRNTGKSLGEGTAR